MIDFAKQNNAEIVCCNFMQIDTCGIQAVRKYTLKHYVFDKETAIKNMLERNMIFNQSWTKIFKRSIIIENNIKHVEGLKTEEDFLFNLQAFMHAEKICVIDKPLYIHTERHHYQKIISDNISANTSIIEYYGSLMLIQQ